MAFDISQRISITNNTDEAINVRDVFDTSVPGSPRSPEIDYVIPSGKTHVFFRNPGVSYIISQSNSVQNRTVKRSILEDGTVRTDVKTRVPEKLAALKKVRG